MLIRTNSGYVFNRKYFDIQKIMNSGQLGLIYRLESGNTVSLNSYIVISETNWCVVTSGQNNTYVDTSNLEYWLNYFDLNTSYKRYVSHVPQSDGFLYNATMYSMGIRILNRNIWEVLISFVLSQNNNIPRITKMIRKLCETYGTHLIYDYYSFPTAYQLKDCEISDFVELGFGYRSEYVYNLIQLANSNIDLKSFFYNRDQLMRVKGIGAKVADCIDLYGNHNLEAFPIDVHIKNIIDREYGGVFDMNMKWKGVYQMFMFYYELMKGV